MDSKENEFVSESQQVSVSNSTVTENVIWSIKGFKKSALESLKGRWKIPLIASLITIGLIICLIVTVYPWEILFSSDFSAFNISSFIGKMLILYAVILLIFPVLTFSYLVLIQKMRKTKEKIVFSDYVEGFSFWNKGILAVLWQCLWYFLWVLLFFVCFAIIMGVSVLLIDANLSFVGTAIIFVGIIIFYVFIFSKYYSYCMNLYILANNPKIKIKKALALSYDDGIPADKRLVEVIDKYGIKCTFNICDSNIGSRGYLSEDEIREMILAHGHEVANHGNRHMALGMVNAKDGLNDMLEGRRRLEQRFSRIITGMAYPDTCRKLVTQHDEIKAYLQALGIVYGRTVGNPNNEFRMPTDWYAWEPTCHHNHPQPLEWFEEFKQLDPDTCYCCDKDPRLFFVWGHSREFDQYNNWEVLEKLCERASDGDDIWFATNIEIYE